ncbi:unnamed protein product, partial [Mesorhabditis belari]|uniref:Neurotransmitter-gated ion-channel transmembrane domain-containing protein n=1 Tax=Mesorhabditis belari TaxID=2138241 RepID=A0AAF3EVS8_9BILA
MTLMGFCLPAHDMSEKISYQMTILLSICFFVTIVSEMTPPTSEAVPILGLFFSVLTLLVSVSTCFTVNVLNFRYRQPGNKHMSKTFYSIFLVWLPWFLLMRRPGVSYERKKERRLNEENEENETNDDAVDVNYPCCCTHDDSPVSIATTTSTSCNTHNSGTQPLLSRMYSMPAEHLNLSRKVGEGILPKQFSVFKRTQSQRIRRVTQFEKYIQKCKEVAADQTNFYYCEYAVAVIDYYTQIHKRMREIRRRLARKKIIAYKTEEWKFAAMALDRLCIVLFTIFFITCIFSISLATPNIDL